MHIVFLSPHSDPQARLGAIDSGGQCIFELELAQALSAVPGVEVSIYCRKRVGDQELSVLNDRLRIKRLVVAGEKVIPKEELGPYLDAFARLTAADLGTAPDVLHGHYWDGGKAMLLTAAHLKAYTTALLWTPHSLGGVKRQDFQGIENEMHYKFVPRIAWETYTMLGSDLVLVSTVDEKQRVMKQYGIDEEKVSVIAPGFDPKLFAPVSKQKCRKRLHLPMDAHIFLAIGRFDRRKGYHHAIRAFAEFQRLFRRNAVLLIMTGKESADTPAQKIYRTELNALAQELGVSNQVMFRDSLDHKDVRFVYAASDIYLCLSEYEPFGLSIIEAMFMSLPVIATRNGGPMNIITHEYNGILAQPIDYSRIANHMQRLMTDEKYRQMILDRGKEDVRRKYMWAARARDFLSAYWTAIYLAKHKTKEVFLADIQSHG